MESDSIEIAGRKVTKTDWNETPESIKLVIEDYERIISALTLRVSNLEEKLNKNSKNSSIPPSKNGFGGGKQVGQQKVKKAAKPRIKQETSERKLYPAAECKEIHEEKPLKELCGVELSRGTIGRARAEINTAIELANTQAQEYVQQQPVVNVDETGFKQYNGDGQNPGKKRGWLWVVVTPKVTFLRSSIESLSSNNPRHFRRLSRAC